ncbi:hypothetical protein HZS_1978, partial [Henneguya salminicola]
RYRNPELNYLIDIQDIYIEKLHQLQMEEVEILALLKKYKPEELFLPDFKNETETSENEDQVGTEDENNLLYEHKID